MKMSNLSQAEQFLDVTKKSGLIEEAKFATYIQKLRAENRLPAEAKDLAELMIADGMLTYFQAEQLLQGKWKRFFIGKYKVLERIGAGGMGQVFLCEHKLMRRRVAIKVLPTARAAEPASLDRFYREARLVAAVDHPNIVRAYDIDQDDKLHFLVLEYVDGVNLQDLVKKAGPLSVTRACHYIYGSCIGLQHAHEMGLVHRDIKPGNILVDRSGVVKILDLGLARFFNDEDDALTKKYDENILGTADYLAPEQALDSHMVDIRADIYSLGGTFYYLLTGKPPFPEGNVAQKLLWHQQREPAPLSNFRADVPPELAAVVSRMMTKDVNKRYQVPQEILAELAPWVQAPIAPPVADELPTLSRAAMGTGGPITSRVLAGVKALNSSATLTPTGSATNIGTATQSGPASSLFPTGSDHSSRPGSTSPLHTAQTMPPSARVPKIVAPVVNPFEDFGEPEPVKPKSVVRKAVAVQSPAKREARLKPKWWLLGGMAFGLLFLLVSIAGYFALKPNTSAITSLEDPKTWYVTKSSNPQLASSTVTTLAAAIEKAKPDDTILLLDDRLDEAPIRISDAGKGAKKGLKIQPGPGRDTVYWMPKYAGARGAPAIEFTYTENLSIRGLVIDLSGQGECGVAVGFNSPGLVLENITVNNPRVSGFRLQQVNSDSSRPATVNRCRVTADNRYEAGILLSSGNRSITISNCRIEGPATSGIKIDGAMAECEIRNNRIWNCDSAIWFTGKLTSENALGVNITANTFHTATVAGLTIDHPLTGAKHRIELARNYFSDVREIVGGDREKLPGLISNDNACDKRSKDGKLKTNPNNIGDDPLPLPNPASDATFLQNPSRLTKYGYRPE
jgi:eukaryotic-like serine/threonine-protein kinase